MEKDNIVFTAQHFLQRQTDGKRKKSSTLKELSLKMRQLLALVLFSNLAICKCSEFEAESPLDRGMECLDSRYDFTSLKAVRINVLSDSALNLNFSGWGEKIEWKTLEDGLKAAKKR